MSQKAPRKCHRKTNTSSAFPNGASVADGANSVVPESGFDLRKQAGDETPAPASKQLYTVLHQTSADKEKQKGAVFTSDVQYVVPGATVPVPEGAQSVLSKAPLGDSGKRKRNNDADEDDDDLGKKFKF